MTFKEIRNTTKLSQKDFSAHFSIPYKTYQKWEIFEDGNSLSGRKPPEYIKPMIVKILSYEGYISDNNNYVKDISSEENHK